MKNAFAIVALASCMATASRAASPPAVPEGLLACAKLQDVNERVRCYDAQVAAMKRPAPSSAPAAAATAPKPAAPAAPRSAPTPPRSAPTPPRSAPTESSFGEELLPPSARPEQSRKEPVLVSSITAMRKVGSDIFLITLANGQVWRQDGNQMTFFRVGYPVRIERHRVGSYHMSSPKLGSKNWVYVRRVR